MSLSIAFVQNLERVEILSFTQDSDATRGTCTVADLMDKNIQALLYKEQDNQEELNAWLKDEIKFYPVRPASKFLNEDNFNSLGQSDTKELVSKMRTSWTLGNNISTLQEIFAIASHLKALWPNDRTAFFEELWFILRNNLGAYDLKLIYNDVELGKSENDKNKLIQACVEGSKKPSSKTGAELEKKLMSHYETSFGPLFQVLEMNQENEQMVSVASVNGSPILLMSKQYDLTQLQISLVSALFQGLQD